MNCVLTLLTAALTRVEVPRHVARHRGDVVVALVDGRLHRLVHEALEDGGDHGCDIAGDAGRTSPSSAERARPARAARRRRRRRRRRRGHRRRRAAHPARIVARRLCQHQRPPAGRAVPMKHPEAELGEASSKKPRASTTRTHTALSRLVYESTPIALTISSMLTPSTFAATRPP